MSKMITVYRGNTTSQVPASALASWQARGWSDKRPENTTAELHVPLVALPNQPDPSSVPDEDHRVRPQDMPMDERGALAQAKAADAEQREQYADERADEQGSLAENKPNTARELSSDEPGQSPTLSERVLTQGDDAQSDETGTRESEGQGSQPSPDKE